MANLFRPLTVYFLAQVQVKRYSTQVSASKKEPRTAIQSDSIRKFLARKEDEERQKRRDALEKKEVRLPSPSGASRSARIDRRFLSLAPTETAVAEVPGPQSQRQGPAHVEEDQVCQ